MAESAYLPGLAIRDQDIRIVPRHSALIRATHWITTASFFGLLVSGIAILLAHPRLYWGETGGVGTPYIIAFPLPFMKGGPSGWGRSLHFLSAWVCILTGLLYLLYGIFTEHFRRHLLPAKSDLGWRSVGRVVSSHFHLRRPAREEAFAYNVLQRIAYLTVVFILFPLVIWTGFAMSPAITSVFPAVVTLLGGQQSARTLHFFVASFLVLFLFIHVAMVCLAGFAPRVWAMIEGHAAGKDRP